MAQRGVPILCYWNGQITNGPQGITYDGSVKKSIRVNYGITHSQLLEKMLAISGTNKRLFGLKMICRYPGAREYIALPIEDDVSVDIMLSAVEQPGVSIVELYLERVPASVDSGNDVPQTMQRCSSSVRSPESEVSVLVLQAQHRSQAIWEKQDPGVLTCRQRVAILMREWPLHDQVRPYVVQAGLYGVHRVGFIQLDWSLITALVERWRQETHTFHFAVGESTVTLQDCAVLLGLRVHGSPVTGTSDLIWGDICEELLGVRPDENVLRGSALRLAWLRAQFHHPPEGADDATLQCYARAYCLALLGSSIFADKSGSEVQLLFLPLLRDLEAAGCLSWGSAALACLYRELCRASRTGSVEIAGPLTLLQLWAWERLHIGRPERLPGRANGLEGGSTAAAVDAVVDADALPEDPLGCRWKCRHTRVQNPRGVLLFYRDQLDQQRDDQIIWQPYTPDVLESLPDIYLSDSHVWRTVSPLICFDIIEWHRPDRVLRQFSLRQEIPDPCDTSVALHGIDRRGRHQFDWQSYHSSYIELWATREATVVDGEPASEPMPYHDQYMVWYRRITRRFITPLGDRPLMGYQPTAAGTHLLVQSLASIHRQCSLTLGDAALSASVSQVLTDIQTTCARALESVDEVRVLETAPSHLQDHIVPATSTGLPVRGRARGRGRGRCRGQGRGLVKSRDTAATSSSMSAPVAPPATTVLVLPPPPPPPPPPAAHPMEEAAPSTPVVPPVRGRPRGRGRGRGCVTTHATSAASSSMLADPSTPPSPDATPVLPPPTVQDAESNHVTGLRKKKSKYLGFYVPPG